MTGLKALAVAVLELLAGTAWTWVISSNLLLDMHRHLALWLTGISNKICSACIHHAHVRLARSCRRLCCLTISERNIRSEEE
jgi:hypothetical protein